jgi:hypothetical protein
MAAHFCREMPEVGIVQPASGTFDLAVQTETHLQSRAMKNPLVPILLLCGFLAGCNKSSTSSAASATSSSKPPDAVEQKLQDFAGSSATNCGRLDVHAAAEQSKAASDCAMQAAQSKHAFFVAYDMPGMAIGVAGNSTGKLYTAQSQGEGPSATVTSGDCPAELRVAGSGRVTCFAPGDMGSMGAGHTAIPQDMPNPHAMPKVK